jgi:twinkle protein
MDDVYPLVCDYYENGYPPGVAANIGEFDSLLTFTGGQLTVVTGSPGSGKSEFIDYITTSLARVHGWKFGVCSFENPVAFHVTKLMEKFIGLSFQFRKNPEHRMSRGEFEHGVALTDRHFYFVNTSQADITIQGILDKLTEVVKRYGIKGVVLDPWNYIEHKVPHGYTETQYISEALSLIKEFAVRTDTHVFLVAHPKKLMKNPQTKEYPVATMYDISGSAHFFNKTDNGISIHRDFNTGVVTVYVQKVRFSWMGKIGFCCYSFDTFIRQYIQI